MIPQSSAFPKGYPSHQLLTKTTQANSSSGFESRVWTWIRHCPLRSSRRYLSKLFVVGNCSFIFTSVCPEVMGTCWVSRAPWGAAGKDCYCRQGGGCWLLLRLTPAAFNCFITVATVVTNDKGQGNVVWLKPVRDDEYNAGAKW